MATHAFVFPCFPLTFRTEHRWYNISHVWNRDFWNMTLYSLKRHIFCFNYQWLVTLNVYAPGKFCSHSTDFITKKKLAEYAWCLLISCLEHFRLWRWKQCVPPKRNFAFCFSVVGCLFFSSTTKLETACTSEMSVTTRLHGIRIQKMLLSVSLDNCFRHWRRNVLFLSHSALSGVIAHNYHFGRFLHKLGECNAPDVPIPIQLT
jgi:hypothetical protein